MFSRRITSINPVLLLPRCVLVCSAGNAFLAADNYGCHVHGIDLSVNMILVAIERAAAAIASSRSNSSNGGAAAAAANGAAAAAAAADGGDAAANGSSSSVVSPRQQQQAPHDVTFEVADVLTRDFEQGSFDVCVSRDALLHVQDKQALFSRCVTLLCYLSHNMLHSFLVLQWFGEHR
jgi:2-polyprenyl-3-methyl-5-hydroxy-6-metoxy-1,4-benzoquinol methylase